MKAPEEKLFRRVFQEAEMFKRISEEEEKTPSDGPEVFIPVIIHPLISFRRRGKVGPGGRGGGSSKRQVFVKKVLVCLILLTLFTFRHVYPDSIFCAAPSSD